MLRSSFDLVTPVVLGKNQKSHILIIYTLLVGHGEVLPRIVPTFCVWYRTQCLVFWSVTLYRACGAEAVVIPDEIFFLILQMGSRGRGLALMI